MYLMILLYEFTMNTILIEDRFDNPKSAYGFNSTSSYLEIRQNLIKSERL